MENLTVTKSQTREEILKASFDAREAEVMHYQINIDNYTLALEKISKLSSDDRYDLAAFVEQLNTLLASEKIEQKKAKIMLSVIKQQVE